MPRYKSNYGNYGMIQKTKMVFFFSKLWSTKFDVKGKL